LKNWNPLLSGTDIKIHLLPIDTSIINKDATKYGTALWQNIEVNSLLAIFGLPPDSPLSVLCVEILPTITNIHQHLNESGNKTAENHFSWLNALNQEIAKEWERTKRYSSENTEMAADTYLQTKPLSNQLGEYRIFTYFTLNRSAFFIFAAPTANITVNN